jgi:hypothetical protein
MCGKKKSRLFCRDLTIVSSSSTSVDHLSEEDGIHKEFICAKPESSEVRIIRKSDDSPSTLA